MSSKLTLYFIPSPRPLDWSSPTSLSRTILKNQIIRKSRFMGHVNVKLEHNGNEIFTGMVAKDIDTARSLLFRKKIGLGIIYHSFEGKLESKEELDIELGKYLEDGNKRINFIQYKISNSMGDRVQEYLETFKELQLDSYYGLVNSPLHGEGAGCSAFGASVAAIMDELNEEVTQAWSNQVLVPMHLTGEPVTQNKVSFFSLLLKNHTWANKNEDHKELFFWDPDLMWSWVEKKLNTDEYTTLQVQNTKGLYKDISEKEIEGNQLFKVESVKSVKPDLTQGSNVDKYL
jgi:hypothetical protein